MALCSGGFDSSCYHMDCNHINDFSCVAKCKWTPAQVDSFNKNCPTGSQSLLQNVLGVSPAGQTQSGAPDTSVDADCNPWGVFKPLCVAGKSFTKGGQSLASLGGNCIPKVPIPCWLIIVIVIVVVLALALKRLR